MTLSVSNATPQLNQDITVHADVTDPDDGQVIQCAIPTYDWGDGAKMSTHCDPPPGTNPCPTRYGPWTPPAASQGHATDDQHHAYPQQGTYTITFTYHPGGADACYNPYASAGSASIMVTVR